MIWRLIVAGLMAAVRIGSRSGTLVARYGRIAFTGLIANRPLIQLGHQEIRAAFAKIGLREAHNAHFIKRLIERGPTYGINTLNDFGRAFNAGIARVGSRVGTTEVVLPGGKLAVVMNQAGELITLLPL